MTARVDNVFIRPMVEADLDQVRAIETLSFHSPWSRRSFEKELRKEYGEPAVAVADGRVVGYVIVWLIADEIHIANVAVHPAWRRKGVGERLIREALMYKEGFSWVGLEVRDSNAAARALYRKLGFQEVGIRENYYVHEGADAVLMVKELEDVFKP